MAGVLLIEAEGLALAFEAPLISNINLRIEEAARVGLTGRSGLGKTQLVETILLSAIGERSAALRAGNLVIADTAIGYGPQRVAVPRWFTVGSFLDRLIRRAPADRLESLSALRTRFGLDRLSGSFPRTLSGGELQRVSVLAALALAGSLVVFDEPLTALDLATKTELLQATREFLERHAIALLLISHDLDVLLTLAQDIHVLGRGGIAASISLAGVSQMDSDIASPVMLAHRAELIAAIRGEVGDFPCTEKEANHGF